MVTFPKEEKVPEASVFLVFTGEGVPNIRRTEKINEHSVAAIAPGWYGSVFAVCLCVRVRVCVRVCVRVSLYYCAIFYTLVTQFTLCFAAARKGLWYCRKP